LLPSLFPRQLQPVATAPAETVYDRAVRVPLVLAIVLAVAPAAAEPEHVIRISSIAPEGTGYARELHAMAQEIHVTTQGRVRVKLYLGGVAGDEPEARERIKRNQLDGVASAAMLCEQLAPSMRVMRVPGLFRNRDEAGAVLSRLLILADREFESSGFHNLGGVMVGPVILFTRTPVRSIAEVRQHTYWIWDADLVMRPIYPMLGFHTLPLPIFEAAPSFERGQHDGFVATPAAALAFQWSAMARYYENLVLAYLVGCLVVANRALDELPIADQQAVRAAAAKASARIDGVGRDMDRQLLGGMFSRQGLSEVPVPSSFRAEFDAAAKKARAELLARHAVDAGIVAKVEDILAELRVKH
jgi:TRAP-type transport system periplasmic protein